MIAVHVLAFAGVRDLIGKGELPLELEQKAPEARHVLDLLCRRHPPLAPHRPYIRLAVNGEYVELDAPLSDGDEVALIPPVAGG